MKFKINKFRKKHIILYFFFVAIIAFIGSIFLYFKQTSVSNMSYKEYEVSYGKIKQTIQLFGTINPLQTARIINAKNSKITKDFFEEGDWVNQGDILYILDTSEIDKKIRLSKLNISKAETNLTVCKDAVENCSVRSPASGTIKELKVSIGDYVTSGNDICTIYSSKKAEVIFTLTDVVALDSVSAKDLLVIGNSKSLTELNIISEDGEYLESLETTLNNFNNYKVGDSCLLKIGDNSFNACVSSIKYDEIPVTSSTSGVVKSVNVKQNGFVKDGDIILKISNAELNANLKQSELELTGARQELSDLQDELAQYTIKSPISGTIIKKYAKAGYYAGTAESESTMMIISDTSSCIIECFVPPKEMQELKVGQEANISSDVLSELDIVGNITKIDCILEDTEIGSGYRIEITPKGNVKIERFGVDIKAEVTLNVKENVIKIPIEYISNNNSINILKNSTTFDYEEVTVETGINDEMFVEILSGLDVGDRIIVFDNKNEEK